MREVVRTSFCFTLHSLKSYPISYICARTFDNKPETSVECQGPSVVRVSERLCTNVALTRHRTRTAAGA